MIKITNTLTKRKQEFKPLTEGEVKMYACGITVSGSAHIGHAIQAMIFDIVRKYLEKQGYNVKYARNYTDVDDKIIAKSNEAGVPAKEYAEARIKEIDRDLADLGVSDPTYLLKATEHIGDIIEFIEKLMEKGYAYATKEGDVYFDVKKYSPYGKLSNRKTENAVSGGRVVLEDNKEDEKDFALWKSAKPGEPYWDSPWGRGRPGWHIECSAMNYSTFGEQIDIHGGGRDLIFPHHENEIAQTEALTGKNFASFWMHNGLVKVNGVKMSKSLNNSILLRDILDKYGREVTRFALLQTNYKNDVNITDNLFEDAEKHLTSFYKTFEKIEALNLKSSKVNPIIDEEFNKAMDDDFNTALAVSNLFEYFKTMNFKLANGDESVIEDYNAVKNTYALLGILQENSKEFLDKIASKLSNGIPSEVTLLANERLEARKVKDFAKSDMLRDKILSLGYSIKDIPNGYEIIKN